MRPFWEIKFDFWRNRLGFWLHGYSVVFMLQSVPDVTKGSITGILALYGFLFILALNLYFFLLIIYKTKLKMRRILSWVFWYPLNLKHLKLIRS